MPTGGRPTLTQFLIEQRRRHPGATGDLNALITDVSLACKAISRKVALGALGLPIGGTGNVNVQAEEQKPLDIESNELFIRSAEWDGHVAGMVSEEMDEAYTLPPQ
ncbi:MAG TPA: class 1 fructose-bisphosphatase, partial [Piscinibacter sp.]|nr:class 1 fructose-bisphosphatase [Piscinibacter sp.]